LFGAWRRFLESRNMDSIVQFDPRLYRCSFGEHGRLARAGSPHNANAF